MAKKKLADAIIEQYLNIPSDSEDDQDFSDAESDDDIEKIRRNLHELNENVSESENEIPVPRSSPSGIDPQPSTSGLARLSRHSRSSLTIPVITNRISNNVTTSQRRKRNLIWKKKSLQANHPQFSGNINLEPPITELDTPLQYFLYFFDDDLLNHIVEEMHKFSIQKDPSKPFLITVNELKKFLGICLIMSIAPLPNIRMYWESELGLPIVRETMTVNHFEKIRQFLHFNDNSLQVPSGRPGHDRLHKIRPILETFKKKCQAIPKRETLSVDEQMCATKATNFLRQYLPNKPHKWGYKLLVLCDDKGMAYDFEIYSGMENNSELRLPNEPDLGASGNIVVRLARTIPRYQEYKLFFDNYYTSAELISYLSKQGIQSLGTVNKGRLGKDLKIPSLKDLKATRTERGHSEEWVADVDGTEVGTVMWYDNKPVVLSSSFVGQQPIDKVSRYCKKQKKYIEVDCPKIVTIYNQHMGGVDLLDSFLGKYKIKMRTKKWYLRLFYHFLDIIVINCWLLHKRVGEQKNEPILTKLKGFKLEIGKSLCLSGPSLQRKRGRPSSVTDDMIEKKKKCNAAILPSRDVRLDRFDHLPIWKEKRQRCKYPQCKGKTYVSCEKCRVELCFNKDNNCFYKFHQ